MAVTAVDVYDPGVFEDGRVFADFTSVYIDRMDILQKIIFIKPDVLVLHPVDDLYREVRALRRIDESIRKMDNPVSAQGNEPAGTNFTPRRAVLNDGWRIGLENPVNGTLAITGEIISDDGLAGAQVVKLDYLPTGVSMLVNYTPPSSEVIVAEAADLSDVLSIVQHIEQSVHVDEAAVTNGDGSTRRPFDNIGDALTLAELIGLDKVHIHSDITIDRNFKNFVGIGIGNPRVDCAGHNLDKSEFEGVTLTGSYSGRIVARDCDLAHNLFGIDGKFYHCGLGGDLFCAVGANVDMIDPFSTIEGPGRPTVSVASSVGTTLGIRGMRGGLTIKNVDHADSDVSVEMATGALTLDSTCILGDVIPRGSCAFVDNSNGSLVDKSGLDSEQMWKGLQL